MQNVDVNLLKKIAIAIVALLCILIFIVGKLTIPPKVEEEEILEALNNGERIVHYDGNIYCTTKIKENNTFKDVLIKLPVDFDENSTREILKKFSTPVDNIKLNFFENKLIYNDSNTYIHDFSKNKTDLFCEGELQLLFEPDSFITLRAGDIYKSTYYSSTYMAKTLEEIAMGEFVRIGEDAENIYYYSSTGQSNVIIVALDKQEFTVRTIDNINILKQTLKGITVTDEYIYAFFSDTNGWNIRKISKKIDKKGNVQIEKIPIDSFEKVEIVDTKYAKPLTFGNSKKKNNFNDLYFYGIKVIEMGEKYGKETVYETKMYKYSFDENTVTEYTGILNELHPASYSGIFNGTIVEIYYGDKKITEYDTGIENLNDVIFNNINIVEDGKNKYLYYEIRVSEIEGTNDTTNILKNTDVILARTLLEGGASQRINVK